MDLRPKSPDRGVQTRPMSAHKDIQTSPIKENTGTQAEPPQDVLIIEHPEEPQKEEPVYPSFEEKLKELRDTYAKDYEEKMNREFEQLDEIKKDFAAK